MRWYSGQLARHAEDMLAAASRALAGAPCAVAGKARLDRASPRISDL